MSVNATVAYVDTPPRLTDGHVLVTLTVTNDGDQDAHCIVVTPADPFTGPFEHEDFPMVEHVAAGETFRADYYVQLEDGTADLPDAPVVESVQVFGPTTE